MSRPSPESEALSRIDRRLADLREANDVFHGMDWDKAVERNNREIHWLADLRSMLVVRAQRPLKLGDIVRMNDRSPYFYDWKDATMKVVSLRIDPEGKHWVSVIEGDQRHRGNGVYDGETTDIDADYLTPVSDTSTEGNGK